MTDTKVLRVERLIEWLTHEPNGRYDVDAVAYVPGWWIMHEPGRNSTERFYVSTPTQPRDKVLRHVVPPAEHVFELRADLVDFLLKRWLPDARHFVDLSKLPRQSEAPAPTSREGIDMAAKRWAPASAGALWHRVGFTNSATALDLYKSRDAPPTGSSVCGTCMLGERHDE